MKAEMKCPACGQPTGLGFRDLFRRQLQCRACGYYAPTTEFLQKSAEQFPGQNPIMPGGGVDTTGWNEPAMRPIETAIHLENTPGYRFSVQIPGSSMRKNFFGILFFTILWCGFMVMWNTIAVTQREWGMLAFGLLHDAVGVGLLLFVFWKIFGREEWRIEQGRFSLRRSVLGIRWTSTWDQGSIESVRIDAVAQKNGPPTPALRVKAAGRVRTLAAGVSLDDARWLKTELQTYLSGRLG